MTTKLQAKLAAIGKHIGDGSTVRVGFLENATYPAAASGAERLLKGVDKLNSVGPHQKGGKPAAVLHVATVAAWNNFGTRRGKPRAFFTNMIAEKSPTWGSVLAQQFAQSQYNTKITLARMGELIKDQLVQAIVNWPADNAPLTVAIKGFNKGLIDQGVMQRSVDYEVRK